MPKSVSNIFTNLFSKNRSGKLVTDAAPLDEPVASTINNTGRSTSNQTPSTSVNATETTAAQLNNDDPSKITEIVRRDDATGSNGMNNALAEPSSINNTLAVNNTQGYNVYQFSQINGLHIGSVYNIKHNASEEKPPEQRRPKSGETIRKTKSIDAMMKSTEPLTFKVLDIISSHLGEGWRDLMRHLGFSDGQIDQMIEDHYIKGVKEVIYQLLYDYSNEDEANVGHITRILWKCGHRECVFILKEFWKTSSNAANQEQGLDNETKIGQEDTVSGENLKFV